MKTNKKAKAKATRKTAKVEDANTWPARDGTRALDLEPGLFQKKSAKEIARSLKASAEASERRKGTPLQSAMGALNFILNRSGKGMESSRRETLTRAKAELRRLFEKDSR